MAGWPTINEYLCQCLQKQKALLFNSTIAVCLCILIQEYLILIYLKYSYVHSDYASRLDDYCTVATVLVWGTHKTITILSFIFFIFFDDAMNDK